MSKQGAHLDKPKSRRTVLPAVAFAAVLVLMLVAMFGLGYYVGKSGTLDTPAKAAGQPFDRASFRMVQPIFEKEA